MAAPALRRADAKLVISATRGWLTLRDVELEVFVEQFQHPETWVSSSRVRLDVSYASFMIWPERVLWARCGPGIGHYPENSQCTASTRNSDARTTCREVRGVHAKPTVGDGIKAGGTPKPGLHDPTSWSKQEVMEVEGETPNVQRHTSMRSSMRARKLQIFWTVNAHGIIYVQSQEIYASLA